MLLVARSSSAVPGDPTDGRDPLDDAVQPLAELNLRPDFELTREQKDKIQAIRAAYDARLDGWRAGHEADFKAQSKRWSDLRSGHLPPGGRPTEEWPKLMKARQDLLATSPDATDAVDQMTAVLTADQRQRYDAAAADVDLGGPRKPDAVGAEVLPVPADGVPKLPGFYKLRFAGKVATADGPKSVRMTYVVFLPKSYKPDGGPYPTLVFLHGSGEVGTDGNGIFAGGLGPAAELRRRAGSRFTDAFPMILVCPQCPPRGERWDQEPVLRTALAVLDEAGRKVRVDPDRVYATGLSMGGKGTWLLAGLDPDRFAAIVPIAASTLDLPLARSLPDVAVWTINGSDDIEDGADHERQMGQAATAAGGDAKVTTLDGQGHGVWQQYYADGKFYPWFLAHRRPTSQERQRRAASARAATTRPATQPMAG